MSKAKARKKPRIPFIRRRQPPGTRPGEITVDPQAPKPVITAMAYGPEGEVIEATIGDPDQIRPLLEQRPVVWVNVDGLGDVDVLRRLGEIFQIHRLALEDVSNVHQRAKVEPYDEHLFLVARMVHYQGHLRTEQLSMFIGDRYVLTFQEFRGDSFDPVRHRIREGRGLIRAGGPSYLAYALLDALIDGYFPVLELFGEKTEALEDEVALHPNEALIHRIHGIKRDLIALRRAMWPHREAINALMREDSPYIAQETRLYLRDCYDHAIQIIDLIETYRELAGGLLDVYLSSISNRMNEVMKVLTIFAAIFIPLTFVAGLYGMNFDYMPELHWRWAYPVALGIMGIIALAMLFLFRRKGWLGAGSGAKTAVNSAESRDETETSR